MGGEKEKGGREGQVTWRSQVAAKKRTAERLERGRKTNGE
jgi:hypothetical protein